MTSWQLATPVAFIIFNRPDTTVRVFAEIARARPRQLLVIADGPRSDKAGEDALCASCRAIIERVDWDCEVKTNFSHVNMGCRRRVSSGLDWVFDTVEEAIILEDDCLPDPSFFRFCAELLERYRGDERIAQISGNNFQFGRQRTSDSYYFSRFNHIWGWATWRRAWAQYDVALSAWPDIRDGNWLLDILGDRRQVKRWRRNFQKVADGFDTWDYQWTFACWINSCLTILPNTNLVSNIGFGEGATHTRNASRMANLATGAMQFPLQHPACIVRDSRADDFTARTVFSDTYIPAILDRVKRLIE